MCALDISQLTYFYISNQTQVDNLYVQFIDIVHEEMSINLKHTNVQHKSLHRAPRKPWWNDQLKLLWTQAQSAEK